MVSGINIFSNGFNTIIAPGVTIGKNSIVSGSFVLIEDIPDYCIIAGNPAEIIKNVILLKRNV